MSLEELTLPDCLEYADGGIRLHGHRVPLASFLHVYLSDPTLSAGELQASFPTVSLPQLRAVVAFCQEHDDTVCGYYRRQVAASDALFQESNGPSFADLKARHEHRQQ
jgi:hypothetical protein